MYSIIESDRSLIYCDSRGNFPLFTVRFKSLYWRKAGENKSADQLYSKAVRYLDTTPTDTPSDDQKAEFEKLLGSCLSNRAQVGLKLSASEGTDKSTGVIADTTRVVALDTIDSGTKSKALFRRAQATRGNTI